MTDELEPAADELIGIVAALSMRNPTYENDHGSWWCTLCDSDRIEEHSDTDHHEPSCPWRRAVEGTIRAWRDDIARRRAEG